jgi:hypothetical protein
MALAWSVVLWLHRCVGVYKKRAAKWRLHRILSAR